MSQIRVTFRNIDTLSNFKTRLHLTGFVQSVEFLSGAELRRNKYSYLNYKQIVWGMQVIFNLLYADQIPEMPVEIIKTSCWKSQGILW